MSLQKRDKKKKKTPNWKVAKSEVAKREVLKSMKVKFLHDIDEPDPSKRSKPRKHSAASVAHIFETVTPMFNAIVRASSNAQLQV